MSNSTISRRSACLECRSRKVRCDGGKPCCRNCLRRGSSCVSPRSSNREKEDMMLMISELSQRLCASPSLHPRRHTPCLHPARTDRLTHQRPARAEQSLASSATSATTTSSSSKGPSTQQHHLTPAPSNAPAEGPASHAGYESLDELSLDHQTSYFPDFDSSLQPGKDGDGMMPGLDLSDLDWENMCGMDLYQPSPYDAIQPVPTSAPAQNCWAEEPTEQAEHEMLVLDAPFPSRKTSQTLTILCLSPPLAISSISIWRIMHVICSTETPSLRP